MRILVDADACPVKEIILKLAKEKNINLEECVLASDAFFPFNDIVNTCFENKIKTIIQPGGSIKDQDSIDTCNEKGISMVFTGVRHFKH